MRPTHHTPTATFKPAVHADRCLLLAAGAAVCAWALSLAWMWAA